MLEILQMAKNCSDSLRDKGLSNPAPILFNSTAQTHSVIEGYESVFIHSSKSQCPVSHCILKDYDCVNSLAPQDNIEISHPTFGIKAKSSKKEGYSISFCFEC